MIGAFLRWLFSPPASTCHTCGSHAPTRILRDQTLTGVTEQHICRRCAAERGEDFDGLGDDLHEEKTLW